MNIVTEDIIRKILTANEDDAEITKLKWNVNSIIIKAGNNYTSEASRLTIEYTKNGKILKKCLFLKVPLNSPMYELGMKSQLYQKELAIYTEILPQLYDIGKEYFWPRCYHVDEKHSLFLKDLSQSGYRIVDRNDQLDFEHCTYALKCLAKLHGLSAKLEKNHRFSELARVDLFHNSQTKELDFFKTISLGLTKFYDNLDPGIQEKYSKQIEYFKGVTREDLIADVSPSNNAFNVLTHGDCWTTNVMFKYDAYGNIKKAKLIDFQVSRWGSPALDLIYFTITSMRFDVYAQYFDLLLNIYLETLNKILKALDCGVYSMENLKNDIEQRYRYALLIFTCILPIALSNPEDPIDMNEVGKNHECGISPIDKAYKNKRYIELATKWFLCYAEKDIFKLEMNDDNPPMKKRTTVGNLTKM